MSVSNITESTQLPLWTFKLTSKIYQPIKEHWNWWENLIPWTSWIWCQWWGRTCCWFHSVPQSSVLLFWSSKKLQRKVQLKQLREKQYNQCYTEIQSFFKDRHLFVTVRLGTTVFRTKCEHDWLFPMLGWNLGLCPY